VRWMEICGELYGACLHLPHHSSSPTSCIAQLTILGYVLGPIFTRNLPALVFGYAGFMVAIGATESAARPTHTYAGMTLHVVACMGVAAFSFLTYAMAAVVRPHPWWSAQFFVPTLGVMLGNAVSGVAVGLGALLEDLATGGDRVELLLALGASRREACRDAVARAVRLALTPILNQMNVIGLVWIPGMMTGQMIAGSDPSQVRKERGGGGGKRG
jgi:putative ABC transport system permease protein